MKYKTTRQLAQFIRAIDRGGLRVPRVLCKVLEEELMPKDPRDRFRQSTIVDGEIASIMEERLGRPIKDPLGLLPSTKTKKTRWPK